MKLIIKQSELEAHCPSRLRQKPSNGKTGRKLCDGTPFSGPRAVLAYLSRYTYRVAISNQRHIRTDSQTVTFKWKDYRAEGADRKKTMTLSVHEFIRRFMIHVFPKRFHHIRHYGLLANGHRAKNISLGRQLLNMQEQNLPPNVQNSKTVDETDTAEPSCPSCGGRMMIIEIFAPGSTPTYHQRAPPPPRGVPS